VGASRRLRESLLCGQDGDLGRSGGPGLQIRRRLRRMGFKPIAGSITVSTDSLVVSPACARCRRILSFPQKPGTPRRCSHNEDIAVKNFAHIPRWRQALPAHSSLLRVQQVLPWRSPSHSLSRLLRAISSLIWRLSGGTHPRPTAPHPTPRVLPTTRHSRLNADRIFAQF